MLYQSALAAFSKFKLNSNRLTVSIGHILGVLLLEGEHWVDPISQNQEVPTHNREWAWGDFGNHGLGLHGRHLHHSGPHNWNGGLTR
ncbi:MAG: hypothetical protein MK106_14975 [Mariniblastus sp.]|nr:hypothetical protein [Mariniblastus sp.]